MVFGSKVSRALRSRSEREASSLRAALEADEQKFFLKRFRSTVLPIGIVTVLSFALVDFLHTPAQAYVFLTWRLAVLPVAAICWFAYEFEKVRDRFYFLPAFFGCAYMGALMGFLSANTGYESSIHVGGLLLLVSFAGSQIPWRIRHIPLFFLLVAGPFWWGVFSRWPDVNRALVFGELTTFMGAVGITMMYYFSGRVARRKASIYKAILERKNKIQRQVIQQKTREGIYLERLASQFSPQVIESIKQGTLDLESRRRRPVACIFVDVQNSTARASRLDHNNYTELMAAFFEECVKIFLQHNVTVGTYLGDGILAFTNAPRDDSDYLTNALNASLQILALHRRKQRVYFETWRSEFNIRIGINSGYATVGFFPSRRHGTYTALGETVSLAARLCARAEINSVAVTKKFLTSIILADSSLRISPLKLADDIKGLEGENFEIFSVRPPLYADLPADHCPNCTIPMKKDSRQLGADFISCPQCGFRDLLPAADKKDSKGNAA